MALLSDDPPTDDLFNYRKFASALAKMIIQNDSTSSFCIALTAPWGNGKTTTLGFISEALSEEVLIVPIRFSPYLYNSHDALVSSFSASLTAAIGDHNSDAKEAVSKAFSALTVTASAASLIAAALLNPANILDIIDRVGGTAKAATDAVKKGAPSAQDQEALLRNAQAALASLNIQVVFLIDEVDRLLPTEIVELFRLIRMVANFPNVRYVVAFDREIVVHALAHQFGSDAAGSRYLEKIFQLEMPLPKPGHLEIRDYVTRHIDLAFAGLSTSIGNVQQDERLQFVTAFEIYLAHHFTNLRIAKRYINSVTLTLELLGGEIDIVDLLLVEAIRAIDPQGFFKLKTLLPILITTFPNRFPSKKDRSAIIDQILECVQFSGSDFLLAEIFPQLNKGTSYAVTADDVLRARARVPRFLYRYLSYSVPRDDVARSHIRSVVSAAANGTDVTDTLIEWLNKLPESLDTLIDELSVVVPTLSQTSATVLLLSTIRVFDALPKSEASIFQSPRRKTLQLSHELLKRTDPDMTTQKLQDTIATQTRLAIPVSGVMAIDSSGAADRPVIGKDNWNRLVQSCVDALNNLDDIKPLFLDAPREVLWLLYDLIKVSGRVEEFSSRLAVRLREDPGNIGYFMLAFVGVTASARAIFPSDLDRGPLERIQEFIPGELLLQTIQSWLGSDVIASIDEFPDRVLNPMQFSSDNGSLQAAQAYWLLTHSD